MGFNLLKLSLILLVIGGLNWGSVGLLGKDLVATLLGRGTAAKAVYVLVGLAAVIVGTRIFGLTEGFENNKANNGANNAEMNASANANGADMNDANNDAAENNMNEGFYACNPDTEEEDGEGGCKPKDM